MKINESNTSVSNTAINSSAKSNTNNKLDSENDSKKSSTKDNGNVFAGDLNLGSDIENKKKKAQSMALNLVRNAFANDNAIDNEINSRKDHISKLQDENNESQEMINSINAERDVVKKGYGVVEGSEEEDNLNLLRKERDSLLDSSITLSDDERSKLDDIHEKGLTDYQTEMLRFDSNEAVYRDKINENSKSIVEDNSIIRGIRLERLKSHEMVDANKQADKILEASNKEIYGMLVEDAKENIDDKMEENKEEAEKAKEEKDELEKRIEDAKAERDKYKDDDSLDDMYELDNILDDVNKTKSTSNTSDMKKSLEQIVGELKLTAEDLKGAVVDNNC